MCQRLKPTGLLRRSSFPYHILLPFLGRKCYLFLSDFSEFLVAETHTGFCISERKIMGDKKLPEFRYGRGWQDDYERKQVSAEEAAAMINRGDRLYLPLGGASVIHHEIAKKKG